MLWVENGRQEHRLDDGNGLRCDCGLLGRSCVFGGELWWEVGKGGSFSVCDVELIVIMDVREHRAVVSRMY